ncbi:hypothetical protein [Corynebacterium sp.]|uniref:GAP1-N2 domain-containing protein n=1 Tax=Corynebacterium sp. TaxID=1720 RepID=UPI0026DCE276|nr:hypothetical protein [Corynebacterium sp.]MDO5076850.1 hypothetical protein [Corynebacterium sp.]
MDKQAQRWAQATYASFRSSGGGSGGWRIGPTVDASAAELAWLQGQAPTRLEPIEAVDDFIGQDAVDQLPRRFEYAPAAVAGADAFLYSVPAGKDATGRPGNVFSHALFDREPSAPRGFAYPIELYEAQEWATPFRPNAVNAVVLPQHGEFSSTQLDSAMAWMMVDTMLGNRIGALYALQRGVEKGPVILLTQNTKEAAMWLYALSLTMSPTEARRVAFSTFERAETLMLRDHCISCVPVQDRARLRAACPIVDVNDSATFVPPETPWNQLTEAVFTPGCDAAAIRAALRRTDAHGAQLGVGLAALVLESPADYGPEARQLAASMGGVTSVKQASVFDNPLGLLGQFPTDISVQPGDAERFRVTLGTVLNLPLAEVYRGELYARWLEYGVRAGIVNAFDGSDPVIATVAAADALFGWLRGPANLRNFRCASLLRAAWQSRFHPQGPHGSEWLRAPGGTIHPQVAAQLGFAQASEQQLRLTDIAARVATNGLGAATPAEYATLFRGMMAMQQAAGYRIPCGGDQLSELWAKVGAGLRETGYQEWLARSDCDELLRVLSGPMYDVVPALLDPWVRGLLADFPPTLKHNPQARETLLRLVTVLLPFAQVAPLFSAHAATEAETCRLLVHALVSGVAWPDDAASDTEVQRVARVARQDYALASVDPASADVVLSNLAQLADSPLFPLSHTPRVRDAVASVATRIVHTQGDAPW